MCPKGRRSLPGGNKKRGNMDKNTKHFLTVLPVFIWTCLVVFSGIAAMNTMKAFSVISGILSIIGAFVFLVRTFQGTDTPSQPRDEKGRFVKKN